jgi:hypothetical protein
MDRRIRGTKCLPLVALLNTTDRTYIVQHGSHVNTDVYSRAGLGLGLMYPWFVHHHAAKNKTSYDHFLPSLSFYEIPPCFSLFVCLSIISLRLCQLLSTRIIAFHINRSTTWERANLKQGINTIYKVTHANDYTTSDHTGKKNSDVPDILQVWNGLLWHRKV